MLTLRPVSVADSADTLADLHIASWNSAYRGILSDAWLDNDLSANRRAYWRDAAREAPEKRLVWLALEGDTPIGFSCLMPDEDPAWGGYIDNLHVLPQARKLGIGRHLMAVMAAHWLTRQRSDPLQLCVFADNHPARRFYERIGGELAETFEEPFFGHPVGHARYLWRDVTALAASAPSPYTRPSSGPYPFQTPPT